GRRGVARPLGGVIRGRRPTGHGARQHGRRRFQRLGGRPLGRGPVHEWRAGLVVRKPRRGLLRPRSTVDGGPPGRRGVRPPPRPMVGDRGGRAGGRPSPPPVPLTTGSPSPSGSPPPRPRPPS